MIIIYPITRGGGGGGVESTRTVFTALVDPFVAKFDPPKYMSFEKVDHGSKIICVHYIVLSYLSFRIIHRGALGKW